MMMCIRLLLSFSLALLLTACATYTKVVPPQKIDGKSLDNFTVSGRASVQYEGGGEYVRFSWQVDKEEQKIHFYSPIGTSVAYLTVNQEGATFQQGKAIHQAENVEELMQRLIRWHLPIKSLRYWIVGLAEPSLAATWTQDVSGWYLNQAGWHIYFTDYVLVDEAGKTWNMPKRIELKNSDLSVKMVVNEWEI